MDSDTLLEELDSKYSDYTWTPRITFAGLLDVPDENGETLTQSPVFGLGIDFLSTNSTQLKIWDLSKKITMQNLFHDGGFSNTGISEDIIDQFS